MTLKWPDGTPKSQGNAFDWRKPAPAKIGGRRPMTAKDVIRNAMRENQESTLGAVGGVRVRRDSK